ncbi:MAG TPA: hypothetical protein DIC60_01790 [Lachnospiraceae bacterium]|nr:hypothetical protein [Lachnospiraceae bacterium]
MSTNKNRKAAVPECERLSPNDLLDESIADIRQNSQYDEHCTAAPLNDIFFETKNNPLSSKGN